MKKRLPHLFKEEGAWKCVGLGNWDGGSTPQIAYNRWYLRVYGRMQSKP